MENSDVLCFKVHYSTSAFLRGHCRQTCCYKGFLLGGISASVSPTAFRRKASNRIAYSANLYRHLSMGFIPHATSQCSELRWSRCTAGICWRGGSECKHATCSWLELTASDNLGMFRPCFHANYFYVVYSTAAARQNRPVVYSEWLRHRTRRSPGFWNRTYRRQFSVLEI